MDGTNFCKQTNQANWCEEERPCHDHGGLCRIDFWCVCEWAFSDIVEKVGCEKVNVDCSATEQGLNDVSCILGSMLSSLVGLPNPAWLCLGNVVSHEADEYRRVLSLGPFFTRSFISLRF